MCVCVGGEGGRQFQFNETQNESIDLYIDFAKTPLTSYPGQIHESVEIQFQWLKKVTTHVSFQKTVNTKFVNAKKPTLSCFSIRNR